MDAAAPITGILLAAGRSSRFGADKLLHPLADGTPIAVAAARALRAACPLAAAVLRREQEDLAGLLRGEGLELVRVRSDNAGMGESLACAVHATSGAKGWVVALADMPFVRAETVRAVFAALARGASLAAPAVAGRRGHPVGFAAEWRDALLALDAEQGARELLRAGRARLELIPCTDEGALLDIDTRDALDR